MLKIALALWEMQTNSNHPQTEQYLTGDHKKFINCNKTERNVKVQYFPFSDFFRKKESTSEKQGPRFEWNKEHVSRYQGQSLKLLR